MPIVKEDIFIIDFEGEPRRSIAERRRKAPARDVAGLVRSIDYSSRPRSTAPRGGARRARQARFGARGLA
jgi:predicted trehalose synthase